MPDRRDHPPLPAALRPLGSVAETLYRCAVNTRNRRFDAGHGVEQFDVPVISVGNLSVGGTGKTPTVAWITERIIHHGLRPAIVLRGYKAGRSGLSDEEAEYLHRFPGIPIVANPDRKSSIRRLLQSEAVRPDCVLLDDGFQHRFVARDLDIVLIDATRNPFRDACLPAGWLREPVESLRRAGAIVLTHSDEVSSDTLASIESACREIAQEIAPNIPIIPARHTWESVQVGDLRAALSWLNDKPAILACGIGNPGPFVRQAAHCVQKVVAEMIRPDHHRWSAADTRTIESLAQQHGSILLTTGKDAPKLLPHFRDGHITIAFPRLTLSFDGNEHVLERAVMGAIRSGQRDTPTGRVS
ncbi:MAG: tetraacyldisaccharide 4'-kinase [Phycisphaeraceae bacterium]|nr:MAG: tetraacyldisaccharide 4'-kinase [Phycisphaeraceae bacterium]